jgi:regulator of PEP synthase PpsR (kinase-PPPase family)
MADAPGNPPTTDRIIFAVSDATGQTARRALLAALIQFPGAHVDVRTVSQVQSRADVRAVVEQAVEVGGTIVHTLVLEEIRRAMYEMAEQHHIATVDLMEPLLIHLQETFGRPPTGRVDTSLSESFQRSAAMSFTVKHDDGQHPEGLPQADIVLVGASRTSKTPISVYLSYHGWRVANVPVLLNTSLPRPLFNVDPRRVIGLSIEPARLQMLRWARVRHMGVQLPDYTNLSTIRREQAYVLEICQQHRWRVLDVTDRSVEETALEIMDMVGEQPRFFS